MAHFARQKMKTVKKENLPVKICPVCTSLLAGEKSGQQFGEK